MSTSSVGNSPTFFSEAESGAPSPTIATALAIRPWMKTLEMALVVSFRPLSSGTPLTTRLPSECANCAYMRVLITGPKRGSLILVESHHMRPAGVLT